ncbi:gliding motility-associated C-terminal domain-containing protein [Mucilaginibacter jinjuensis]|uniref:Gliding motility-associated C-terminal domain-containing protein n=1 Tax=Mucilaginibacter jinjuensis TaxID=1176721 RepID=A0ABY7T2S4_9SPHI|nr:gliding motility-associated C-terminal domain-containing protein [Mucilaginibacter jinjuensis]WCT10739.1 gliding motility-associated C-terminal domain-containing protein [Mucilaginibacter jinjuensis]
MKKLLLLILITLGYASYTAAIAGRYNPPPATFPTTITGPVADGGNVTSSPIAITIALDKTASPALKLSDFAIPTANGTLSGLTEKVTLTYLNQFGTIGSGNGNLNQPNDLAVDAAGNTYVTDGNNLTANSGNNRVEIFDKNGAYVGQFGSFGVSNEQFNQPYGIAVSTSGVIYVADAGNNRVQVFSSPGIYLTSIGTSGTIATGQLNKPQGIYLDEGHHELYVADAGNNRVAVFDTNLGTLSRQYGSSGSASGQFAGPSGVVVTGGVIYVTDSGNRRIVKFDMAGNPLGTIGVPGTGNGEFLSPAGITTDGIGKIYVVDKSTTSRVEIFDIATDGFLGIGGSTGVGDGNLRFPSGITADKNGNIYVADRNNNRVETFTAKEQYTVNLVPTGNGPELITINLASVVKDISGEFNALATYSVNYTATPASPTNLVATSLDGSYRLDWEDANSISDNINGYNIYEGSSSTNLTILTSVDANTTTYQSEISVTNGTPLYFYIKAATTNKESSPSNVVMVIPKGNPTITAGTIPNKKYNDASFDIQPLLHPSSASAGAFTYSLDPSSVGATLTAPSTINIVGVGHVDIIISQAATTTYNAATLHVGFDIDKDTPQINWSPATTLTYGTELGAGYFSATATKAGTTTPALAGSTAITYSYNNSPIDEHTILPVGNDDLIATYVPSSPDDANYSGTGKTVTVHVGQASPLINWALSGTYPAKTAISTLETATVTGIGGVTLNGNKVYSPSGGQLHYTGSAQDLTVTYTPSSPDDVSYTGGSKTISVTVTQLDPSLNWADQGHIAYGTGLPAGIFDASVLTAGLTGHFTYTESAGTVLSKGVHTLHAHFVPDDTDYAPKDITTQITVDAAIPQIVWTDPLAPITYGTALSNVQLNATTVGNVSGNMSYSQLLGTVLPVGSGEVITATFTASDPNYDPTPVVFTSHIDVNRATPQINWTPSTTLTYGVELGLAYFNATATKAGTVTPALQGTITYSYNNSPIDEHTILPVGNDDLIATYVPSSPDDANYSGTGKTVTVHVGQASPLINWALSGTYPAKTAISTLETATVTGIGGVTLNGNKVYSPSGGQLHYTGSAQDLTVTYTPSSPDDVSYTGGSKTISVTVTQLDPSLNWADQGHIAYGTGLPAGIFDASVLTAGLTGHFTYTESAGTVLSKGVHTLHAHFVPDDTDYAPKDITTQITVDAAIPQIVWTDPLAPITYGTALSNVQLNATTVGNVSGNMSYSQPLGTVLPVGSGEVITATFTASDPNYDPTPVVFTSHIDVNRATPQINWTPSTTLTYGVELGLAYFNATATKAGRVTPALQGTITYSYNNSPIDEHTILPVGNDDLIATYVPSSPDDANYSGTGKTVTVHVGQASPLINWALSGTYPAKTAISTLETATVTGIGGVTLNGNKVYSPSGGQLHYTGSAQDLTVTYTPSSPDDVSYTGGSKTISVTVTQLDPSLNWADQGHIAYGTGLPAGIFDASVLTAGLTGHFTYTESAGTVLSKGVHTLHAHFVPDDTDYAPKDITTQITVDAAIPQIVWTDPLAPITYGTALSNVQLNATTVGNVSGNMSYSQLLGTVLPVGSGEVITATFTASDPNYDPTPVVFTSHITVGQVTPAITWNPLPMTVGTALTMDQLNASTVTTTGTFTFNPPLGTIMNTQGNQTLAAKFTPTDAVNYKTVNVLATVTVNPVNISAINPQINWADPAPISYGTVLGRTQLNATATVPNTTTPVIGVFSYTPDATSSVLPVGTHTITAYFTPTNTALYNQVSKTVSITVTPVTPVIIWTKPVAISVGTVLSNAQLNAQITNSIDGTFVYTPAIGSVMNTVGTGQPLSVVFHPTDTRNYTDNITANTTIDVYAVDITKITPVINWNRPADITYGTLINSVQQNATTADASIHGTFTYSTDGTVIPLAVGSRTLSVTFTPTDGAHYNPANQSVTINVKPAQPVISWTAPGPITYGTALSANQLNATANVDGTFVYSPNFGEVLNVGTQTLLATFTPGSNNYQVAGKTVSITVNKANPVIAWATPSNIAQGVALSATQLNATANVPGTFVYTPAIGDVLNAGANQTLSVTFTPTDASNYNSVTKTVQIGVGKLTPVLTWTNPTAITYGTALGDQQLYASTTVPGTFTYSPAAGTVLHAGSNQTLAVTFTPTDAVNYITVTKNVAITVSKAALNVSTNDVSRPYNQPNPDFTINYSGFVNGDTQANLTTQATATTTATTASLVGIYPITVNGAVSNDYTFRYVNATLTVTTIGRNLTFNQLPVKTYGDPDFDAGATATSGEPIIYTSSNTAVATIVNGQIHIVGAGYVTITASLPVNPDYNTTPSISQFMVVNKAAQTIDFANIPVQLRGTTYDLSNIKSSSGLPVTFTTNDPVIASINGLTVSSLRVGITGIVANQAGDANYYAANTVVRNLEVKDLNREVIVHPAVSPNGDGINDVLYIEGINEHPDNRVTIINRNGVRVYEINGYDNTNKFFDGRSNFTGAKQQAGTYFYLVEYVVNGVGRHLTGYFVLKYD